MRVNRHPRSCFISGMRIEFSKELELFSKLSVVPKHLSLGHPAIIHPLAQNLIADELSRPNRFLDRLDLLMFWLNFVFDYEHESTQRLPRCSTTF